MEFLEKKITTTHRVQEHELLKRLEHFCKRAGLEFPTDAWPKDDRKAYFLLGLCAIEDMKTLVFAKGSHGSMTGHASATCLSRMKRSSQRGAERSMIDISCAPHAGLILSWPKQP